MKSIRNRAAGAVMGALVGEALAVGPHWYYDLDEMRRDYGDWVAYYTDPLPGRYHAGLKGGQLSQAGIIAKMLLCSVVEMGAYEEADFCRRLDEELFPLLDGTPQNGPGGYTSQATREAWQKRVAQQLPWGQVGGDCDTTEAAERGFVLAARYARNLPQVAQVVSANCRLTQVDEAIVAMTTAYCCVVAALVAGNTLDASITGKLMTALGRGKWPLASLDALLTPGYMARAAADAAITIEPAWKVSLVYGMPCAIYHQLPAAYYLAARFHDDFESAVLHAVNGGGQNQARAMLTGALVGAQVSVRGIPQRFLEGLENSEELMLLAQRLGAAAADEAA